MSVRTRFAPSPTGFLHVGGVRTALFNYLLARKHSGQFILRLEDTDRERFLAEGIEQIVEALDWLGLKPDEGFWISEGKHQNIEFVQSERQKTGLYQKYAEQLVKAGLAYYSPTAPEELEKLREQAKREKKPFLYRKNLDSNNTTNITPNTPIRFDTLEQAKRSKKWQDFVDWDDKVMGNVHQKYEGIDDFILIKSDGFPTYNFANVIDDIEMKISHVLRGQEFVASTPKHLMIYEALEADHPEFAHLPTINGADKKKLSKRTGDANTLDYRNKGYLPDALLNFLVLLGWNDSTEQEIFSMDDMKQKFSLAGVNKSSAIFDQRRLDWINGYYIRTLKLDDFYKKVRDFWPKEAEGHDEDYKKAVLGVVQERLKYFAELPELSMFFFKDLPVDPKLISSHKQLGKLEKGELKNLLIKSRVVLEQSNFSDQDLSEKLNALLKETGQKPAALFSLIRIATTQAPASPGLAETLAVLGKDTSLRRITTMLEHLDK